MAYADSLNLVMIMNAIGGVSRLVLNYFADRTGTLTMFAPTVATASILMYCWAAVSSTPGLYGWASVSAIAISGVQSLFPPSVAALTTDLQKQGTRIGMVFTIVSFAVLIGPPIEGALITSMGGRYVAAQAFAGSSLVLGSVFLTVARAIKRRKLGEDLGAKV